MNQKIVDALTKMGFKVDSMHNGAVEMMIKPLETKYLTDANLMAGGGKLSLWVRDLDGHRHSQICIARMRLTIENVTLFINRLKSI